MEDSQESLHYKLIEKFFDLLNLSMTPELNTVQLVAVLLVVIQEFVYVFVLHAVAFWIFPRLKASIPNPPNLLKGLIALEPL